MNSILLMPKIITKFQLSTNLLTACFELLSSRQHKQLSTGSEERKRFFKILYGLRGLQIDDQGRAQIWAQSHRCFTVKRRRTTRSDEHESRA